MTCDELGPEVVALACDALAAEDAAKVEAHLAGCAPCRAELAAARRLVGASREAPSAAMSAGGLERLLVAFRKERDAAATPAHADVPPPAAMRSPRSRILTIGIPLAAAATILVAVALRSHAHEARVLAGSGWFLAAGASPEAGLVLGSDSTAFEFAEGDEISSGAGKLSVRIELEPGPAAAPRADAPPPGRVELTLLPGARIVRRTSADLDLLAGAVDVVAGPLAEPLTLHAGPGYATVRGTRFTAWTSEKRLVVAVAEGKVDLGRENGPSKPLTAGEEGLVDSQRLLERRADGHRAGEGFLTPRARLSVEAVPGTPARQTIRVRLDAGDGGPVSILPFDDSEPRFLLRLKGDDGREHEVKLQRTMLEVAPPAATARTWRLDAEHAYELTVEPKALGLAPGRYEASLRYMSYRARSDGAEWLGVVESDPVTFEVPAR